MPPFCFPFLPIALMSGIARYLLFALIASAPALVAAGELRLEGPLVQGALVRGVTEAGAAVRFRGGRVRVSPAGMFLIGFGRDDTGTFEIEVRHPDGSVTRRSLAIAGRKYQVQRIDGLPPNMVTPSAEELARIRREAALIAEVRARDTGDALFASGFAWPLVGTVTGIYGSQRILNGEPRRPHYGIDIAAPEGAPVAAPAAGIVALAEPGLFFTGGTIMLDHGHGLTSVYSHLSEITAKMGARVGRGETIGRVGATGRVTGSHLDWRVNLFTTRLDPALLVGPMPDR